MMTESGHEGEHEHHHHHHPQEVVDQAIIAGEPIVIEIHENSNNELHVTPLGSRHASRPASIRSSNKTQQHNENNNDHKKTVDFEFAVAGDDGSKVVVPNTSHINLTNRDPEHINQHLKVAFEDIFAEPHPTIFSFDSIWRTSFQVFSLVKLWTYRILSLICAIPAAIFWAINFACLAFCHIWCCVPCFRLYTINMTLARKYFEAFMDCCISPVCLSVGRVFSSIRIGVIKTSDYTDFHQV